MKPIKSLCSIPLFRSCGLSMLLALSGCANLSPSARELADDYRGSPTAPRAATNAYADALARFGRLLEVYTSRPYVIQVSDVADSTGVSAMSGGEIPMNLTAMVQSAINRIGERIRLAPLDTTSIAVATVYGTGLPQPDIRISGGVTEFDRALGSSASKFDFGTTIGRGRNATDLSADYGRNASFSKLTFDVNAIDFRTGMAIPRVQAVTSIRVLNDSQEGSLNIAILGAGLGFERKTRMLQGRHEAVRLVVDMSILQLIGRYLAVPYWRCLPEGVEDEVVLERVRRGYVRLNPTARLKQVQELLMLYGYRVRASGQLDAPTRQALKALQERAQRPFADPTAVEAYLWLYLNLPAGTR